MGFRSLGMAVLLLTPAVAQEKLIVRVYDLVGVPGSVLDKATQEAAGILQEARVETQWFNCSPSATRTQSEPACGGPVLPSHVTVRILPGFQEAFHWKSSGGAALGEALGMALRAKGTGGNYVNIYFNAVRLRAQGSDADRARLLGYAITHEIGHLLLGPQHSTGIMAAHWAKKDLLKILADKLSFSPSHRQRLEGQVRARLRADQQVALPSR